MPQTPRRVMKVPPLALRFDGIDDYVEVVLSSFSFSQFTVMITVMDYAHSPARYERIIGLYDYARNRMWNIYVSRFQPSPMVLEVWRPNGSIFLVGIESQMPIGEWHMYAVTYDGTYRTYKDGVLVATVTDVPPRDLGQYYLYIGSVRTVDAAWAYIASVMIYSRALSAVEIAWNYDNPNNPIRDGLVLWLHWDSIDISSGKWRDKSGNGNDGTIYGSTLVQIIKTPKRILSPTRVLSPVR